MMAAAARKLHSSDGAPWMRQCVTLDNTPHGGYRMTIISTRKPLYLSCTSATCSTATRHGNASTTTTGYCITLTVHSLYLTRTNDAPHALSCTPQGIWLRQCTSITSIPHALQSAPPPNSLFRSACLSLFVSGSSTSVYVIRRCNASNCFRIAQEVSLRREKACIVTAEGGNGRT